MSYEPLTERPVTMCPECSGEIDLTAAEPGDTITCVVCGAEWAVISLVPPEIDVFDSEG